MSEIAIYEKEPHPRAGGDSQHHNDQPSEGAVSIHAPARGATSGSVLDLNAQIRVSIHAPARGATCGAPARGRSDPVSIHAPARGATWYSGRGEAPGKCFNPRPRAGGDDRDRGRRRGRVVSIHAPARGATAQRARAGRAQTSFNPRPRAGGDARESPHVQREVVSIHAPARGATLAQLPVQRAGMVSIHAPARGATWLTAEQAGLYTLFQSTPPRGGRRRSRLSMRPQPSFNPRPRAGGDSKTCSNLAFGWVSIHAPARGAT